MSWLATIAEFVAAFMIVLGAAFALIGSWGLVRLPTLMERLHGPSYYCHEKSGASQFDKPDEEPDSEDDWPWHQPAFGPGTVSAYDGY